MPVGVRVYPQSYSDSVSLATVARKVRRLPGVRDAAVVMGTEGNRRWLDQAGLLEGSPPPFTAEDLLVCVLAETAALVEQSLSRAEALLRQRRPALGTILPYQPRSLRTAQRMLPQADMAVISVRGRYAGHLAWEALERGLHVLLFSGGMSLEEEIALKEDASRRGRWLLGPEAGAAVLNGISFGFASVLPWGHVALVGTDGGAMQQVSTLIVREGALVGISQAIAVGARDLTAAIGGRGTLGAVRALLEDEESHVLVLLGFGADPAVARRIVDLMERGAKPAVVVFPGMDREEIVRAGLTPARTLQEAAMLAVALDRGAPLAGVQKILDAENEGLFSQAQVLGEGLHPGQRYLRGLYSSCSLCQETRYILEGLLGPVRSNLPGKVRDRLSNAHRSMGHTLVDMSGDEFTTGSLHPILDCTRRNRRLLQEAEDPEVAIILLDVILGVGAHPDPLGEMSPAIQSARAIADAGGRDLLVLASVCGTRADPQDLEVQEEKLRDAGAVVLPSNAAAAKLAGLIGCACGSGGWVGMEGGRLAPLDTWES